MPDHLVLAFRVLGWTLGSGGIAWAAWVFMLRSGRRPSGAQMAGTLVGALWVVITLLTLSGVLHLLALSIFGLFGLGVGLAVHFGFRGAGVWKRLPHDLRRLGRIVRLGWRTPLGWVVFLGWVPVILYVIRGLAVPPRGWDGLLYHLPRAAHWIQEGALSPFLAPDEWTFYSHFPPGGDLLWTWLLLPRGTELFLVLGQGLIFLGIFLGVRGLAMELGAPPRTGSLAGAICLWIPAVLHYGTSCNIDNLVLFCVVVTIWFVLRFERTLDLNDALVPGLALGIAASAKPTAWPMIPIFLLAMVFIGRKCHREARTSLAVLLLMANLPWVISMAWTAGLTGSPTYPFFIRFLNTSLFEGNALMERSFRGELQPVLVDTRVFIEGLFWGSTIKGLRHLNLGFVGLLGLLLGVLGIPLVLGSRPRKVGVLFLCFCAAIPFLTVWSPAVAAQRSNFAHTVGRFLTATPALLVAVAAAWRIRAMPALLTGVLLAGAWQARPAGVPAQEVVWGLPVAVVMALLGWGIYRGMCDRRATRSNLRTILLLALLSPILLIEAARPLRARHRAEAFKACATPPWSGFEAHPLFILGDGWRPWVTLDQPTPLRIAYTAGWDGMACNWLTFPLYGSRLQNHVSYVPVTSDGGIVDYSTPGEVAKAAHVDAWVRRLRERRIDYLVTGSPPPPEAAWARELPHVFEWPAVLETPTAMVLRVKPR